ncbi:hypothetical protein K474DRAFT_1669600 [Panus rudis PR-1116 ss-1]|nr:hypothetical protein K474DRAFT_1669600 [Panus rudis PR-1116 ss-1]
MSKHPASSLQPPLFEHGKAQAYATTGGAISVTNSPRDTAIAVFPSIIVDPPALKPAQYASNVYFSMEQKAPLSERRTFLTDTSVIFAGLQSLYKNVRIDALEGIRPDETQNIIRKFAIDYTNFAKECYTYCSRNEDRTEPLQLDADHYRILYSCLSLFTTLYAPISGQEDVPIGEDLLEWLNTHYIEPSSEDGLELSKLERPWENEMFWPYVTRAVLRGFSKAASFFLDILSSKHPSVHLQRLSKHLAPLITGHPRLQQFDAERDFAIASRRWKEKVKTLRVELDRIPEDARDDGFENWWDRFSDIVGVLEGRGEVVKRICQENSADWKEVTVAWGVFVDSRLRRHELPDIVAEVQDELPPDPTDLEDAIQSALFSGNPRQAISDAANFDIWLGAHLADMMQGLKLIKPEPDDSELSLRDRHIIAYTEYLRTDPSLWRLTVDYLRTCGEIGLEMADEILVRVPLKLEAPKSAGNLDVESAQIREGRLAGVLKEVLATCHDYQREGVRRMVCKIAAQTFLKEKEYGLAVSYYASAEDWPGLGRVVDRVLNEYTISGPVKFAQMVAEIAPTLHHLRTQSANWENAIFIYRLMFAVRFAEFHQRRINGELEDAAADVVSIFQDEIAPKAWWAVVLWDAIGLLQHESMLFSSADTVLFMRKVEEIATGAAHGSSDEYLTVLRKTMRNGDEKQALQRLQMIRLALVRYYARCGVVGVGGKLANVRSGLL